MISSVRVVRFKRFANEVFDLSGDTILLAGPNNSGKTTLLHAISAWNLALTRWRSERGETGGKKKRISVVLDEFTALPLREMNLLWLNRHTAARVAGQKQPKPAPIYVELTAKAGELVAESLAMEFLYANEKLVYVRPVKSADNPEPVDKIPQFAKDIQVVHVPAFSGIGTQEPKHAPGIQNKLVGEGRPGEIVRNLLLEIWEASGRNPNKSPWLGLVEDMRRLFSIHLEAPEFSDARPYIVCEYRPPVNPLDRSHRPPKLDIANAGSGFHQVLMLLAFFHGRPSSILLLDEPDAHLHFILQREIFDHLRSVAGQRKCKLIIATHAEVLLDGAEPDQIISFVGHPPKRLVRTEEKKRLRDALRRLSSLDLLQAEQSGAVLYVEDDSDAKLMREWSIVLNHPAQKFLKFAYVYTLKGKGNLDAAKQHFQCLQLARPEIRGLCVVDRDNDQSGDVPTMPSGLEARKWGRYEIENYLIHPAAIKRFLRESRSEPVLDEQLIDKEFAASFPAGTDFLGNLQTLRDLKASDFLVDVLRKTGRPLEKSDLYQIAKAMTRAEVHPDVTTMLDAVAEMLPETIPLADANVAPLDTNGVDEVAESPPESELDE